MKKYIYLLGLTLILGCSSMGVKTGENWVNDRIAKMTIEEKVGQMMVPAYAPRFFNEGNAQFNRLLKLVEKYYVGGVMFFRGNPYSVGRSVDRLQAAAKTPLLVMADMEWGLPMRVDESTRFLQNMATGAAGNEDYAYQIGKITGKEARAIGVHIGFAPVMDVNNNPDNIIINTRSYGEDPALVSKMGTAFIRGLQEEGVYATAKHFPGHGDTDVDPHMSLPTINASRERINNLELPPFQAAVDAGVQCIMVAHITFSQIKEMQGRPTTLDPYFIKTVLREEMGFKGLVVSDAMDMGGITDNYWSGEAAVMAINAGIDMVLLPPNFESTYKFVLQAVKEGRISMERLDEAVRRILRAKADHGLEKKPLYSEDNLEKIMSDSKSAWKAEQIANASMTLLRDDKNVIPFKAEKIGKLLVLTVTDEDGTAWRGATMNREAAVRVPNMKAVFVDPRSTEEEISQIIIEADSVDAIIVGVYVKWRDRKGTISLPDTTVELLKNVFKIDKPMAVIAFGSPYTLRQIPEVPSYLVAYETVSLAQRAAIKALFGEIPIKAKLPVSIPGYYEIGDGLERNVRKMELVGNIKDELFKETYAVINAAIADSVFPGAQIAIIRKGELVSNRSFGHQTYDASSPEITPETMYDLASVTKIVATTVVAMNLWEKKKIMLDIPVKSYLPGFGGGEKDRVTIRHLLTHSSGAHWWTDLWNQATDKEAAYKHIYELPLDFTPGDSMIYSDLGLILMMDIIETVTGSTLDKLANRLYYKPLGMKNTMYNPPKGLLGRIAPTEIGGSMDRGLIHGDVHDENAFFLGGVSSHAGLFSTAEDLASMAQMLINRGIYKHRRFFKPETIEYWTAAQNITPNSDRAIGWRTPTAPGSSAGDYFSEGSYGHTGFTGTTFWIDPNREIALILLTNRVHPTRERGGIYQVRRDFHNSVMRALLTEMGEPIPELNDLSEN
ncbi:MAG: serine hydrolase [Candidatus Marinimicrobia bacterium]|nr:serine hydrolase [Candidatus Neomarinimicrobiota bacterium]